MTFKMPLMRSFLFKSFFSYIVLKQIYIKCAVCHISVHYQTPYGIIRVTYPLKSLLPPAPSHMLTVVRLFAVSNKTNVRGKTYN